MNNMIMSRKIVFLVLIVLVPFFLSAEVKTLTSLTRTDPAVDSLRDNISTSIYIIKSKRDKNKLPDLVFYAYTAKDGDNIWNIVARTSLDIDTILTVNKLESPSDIKPGKKIYIPNMRGIIIKVGQKDTLDSLSEKYKVEKQYLTHVNKMDTLSKSHVFVPCGMLTTAERTAFLSNGFSAPLTPIRISSGFGMRSDPFLHVPRFHSGIDIRCTTGTPIKASKSGVVKFAGFKKDYGNLVIISHSNGFETYYGHLHQIEVTKNQAVKRGTVIAYSGNTGRSTGPHLHFEIRQNNKPINPLKKLQVNN